MGKFVKLHICYKIYTVLVNILPAFKCLIKCVICYLFKNTKNCVNNRKCYGFTQFEITLTNQSNLRILLQIWIQIPVYLAFFTKLCARIDLYVKTEY